jgi:hypothetical protein
VRSSFKPATVKSTVHALNQMAEEDDKQDSINPDKDIMTYKATKISAEDDIVLVPSSQLKFSGAYEDPSHHITVVDTRGDDDHTIAKFDQSMNNSDTQRRSRTRVDYKALNHHGKTAALFIASVVNNKEDNNMTINQAYTLFGETMVRESINKEIQSLLNYNTWEYIKPADTTQDMAKSAIPCKIFLKMKYHANGEPNKLKSRLVAGGHRQKKGSYGETFAPTIATSNLLLSLSIGAYYKKPVATFDVPNAYLHVTNVNNNIMIINKEITDILLLDRPELQQFLTSKGTILVKLNKDLYGLKQSANGWYEALSTALVNAGYAKNGMDDCLLYKRESDNSLAIIDLHVDDITTIASFQEIERVQNILEKVFNVTLTVNKDQDNLEYLGMKIRVTSNGTYVSQPGYIRAAAAKYNVSNEFSTPSTTTFFQRNENDVLYNNPTKFKSILATLLYAATHSRPDIIKEIVFLAQYSLKPTVEDYNKLLRVFGYLISTAEKELILNPSDLKLYIYSDASFNTHCDGKSHYGYLVTIGNTGALITKSKKMKTTATSSTESELFAMSEACKVAIDKLEVLKEMGLHLEDAVTVYVDNLPSIQVATGNNRRSKYLRVRYHHVQELIKENLIKLEHIYTDAQRADILTKPMGGALFRKQRDWLLGNTE